MLSKFYEYFLNNKRCHKCHNFLHSVRIVSNLLIFNLFINGLIFRERICEKFFYTCELLNRLLKE